MAKEKQVEEPINVDKPEAPKNVDNDFNTPETEEETAALKELFKEILEHDEDDDFYDDEDDEDDGKQKDQQQQQPMEVTPDKEPPAEQS